MFFYVTCTFEMLAYNNFVQKFLLSKLISVSFVFVFGFLVVDCFLFRNGS